MNREKREALQRLHDDYRKRVREEAMRSYDKKLSEDEITYIHKNHDDGC